MARGQGEDALAEHVGRQMADLAGLACLELAEHLAGLLHQPELPVKLAQQKEPPVAADGAAPEIKHDFPALSSLKNYR